MNAQQRISAVVQWCMDTERETRQDLARALGVGKSTLSAKLLGERRWSTDDLDVLAEHYKVEQGFFLQDPALLPKARLSVRDLAGEAFATVVSGTHRYPTARRSGGLVLTLPIHRTAFSEVAA